MQAILANAETLRSFQEALSTAKSIIGSDDRAIALSEIAKAQASSGMTKEATATFQEAISTAKSIEDSNDRAKALIEIAKAQASSGMTKEATATFQEAISTAKSIEDSDERAKALIEIAKAQASSGMTKEATATFQEAISTAKSIEDSNDRAKALREIAKAQASSGMTKEALSTAKSIENDYDRAAALREIAKAQAQAGMIKEASSTFQEAISTAKSIEDDYNRASVLTGIAKAQAQSGMTKDASSTFQEALSTAKSIEDDYYRASVLTGIAKAQAQFGMFQEAISTAKSIEYSDFRAEALGEIAKAQAQFGMFQEALSTAKSIENGYFRAYALSAIAKAQVQAGMLQEALSTAKSIENGYFRAYALSAIAIAQASSGMIKEASSTFQEAISAAKSIIGSDDRAIALSEIAKAQASSGMINEALSTAKSIENSDDRAVALREIAKAQASSGMTKEATATFQEAISTAKSIEDDYNRAYALREIAKAQTSSAKLIQPVQYDTFISMLPSADTTLIGAIGMQLPLSEMDKVLSSLKDPVKRKRAEMLMTEARTSLYHIYNISEEEKELLFNKYREEFRSYLSKAEEHKHYELKLISRILFNLDVSTGEHTSFALLFDAAKKLPAGSDAINRILYTLAEMDSYKGKDLVMQMISKGSLDPRVEWLLLHKLSETKYLDPTLPQFYEKEIKGTSGKENTSKKAEILETIRKLKSEVGINPDSSILDFLLNKKIKDREGKEAVTVDEKIALAKEYKSEFDRIKDKDALVSSLSKDRTKAIFYFILYGGRTRFSLVNNYDSSKFMKALEVASNLEIHNGPLDEFVSMMKDKNVRERLLAGTFPVTGEKYSKEIRVDVSNSEELSSIEKFASEIFGKNQMGAILKVKHYMNRLREMGDNDLADRISKAGGLADLPQLLSEAESRHPELVVEVEKKHSVLWSKMAEKKIFSMSLYAALTNDANKISIKELIKNIEIQRKALEFAVRQQYKAGAIEKMVRDERLEALQEKSKAKLLAYLLSETIRSDTEIENRLLSEWQAHLDQVFQSYDRLGAAETERVKERTVVLRYLDKREDLIECLRFADSAQCCFNSKNYRIEGHNVGALEWIARIWKDPLSFVFQIEAPEAEGTRNAIGFVFGSFGIFEGKPAVLLNGVYMEGRTKTAAHSILATIENDFSRPLGAVAQFVASRHGGSVDMPKEYSNKQVTVRRLRAIKGSDGRPETEVYDDMNVGANNESTTDGNFWHKEIS
ncbi:MAG: hypothetical protein QXT72_01980 [Candidatus Micrarchaeia archaeon]